MLFFIDVLVFLALPYLAWRLLRGAAPMAVLPILTGLCISVAAHHLGFDKTLVGPSALGSIIGWVGVLILAFSAGLETRTMAEGPWIGPQLFASAGAALALPFAAGFALALSGVLDAILLPPKDVPPLLAASALGLCIAVSALPVLVGVVRELPAADRPTGNLALRIAALDDAILWVGLAVLLFLFIGQTEGGFLAMGAEGVLGIALFVAMALARRPLERLGAPHWTVALALGAVWLAAGSWATTVLGLHELLGAYFAGALAPSGWARRMNPELMGKVALFGLSPLFFGHRGLSIDGSALTPLALGLSLILLLVAGGSKLAALHAVPPERDMPARERTRLGVLLQCKGLMEIVAASILHQNGLISATTFAILVTLAIVSTTLTVPLFQLASRVAGRKAAAPTDQPAPRRGQG
jgi:Kef-type K+ transport system membrane component KefB